MTSSRLPVIISMEGGVAGHPRHCGIVVRRWRAWGPTGSRGGEAVKPGDH